MTTYSLDVRDRPGLLFAMMRRFASDHSRIALEGDLASTELYRLEGASYEETEILKRATTAPRLDFVVLPLIPARLVEIRNAIQSKIAFGGGIEASFTFRLKLTESWHSPRTTISTTTPLS